MRAAARRVAALLLIATASLAVANVPSAGADILIRQVHPDNVNAFDGGDWVELQFTANGEATAGKHIITYFSGGMQRTDFTIPVNPLNSDSQRTYLIGSGSTVGGVTPNFNAGTDFNPTSQDGAVCLTSPAPALTKLDCVAYGNYTNSTSLPVGSPAVATQIGQTIQRTIARGCATALDGADDTNNSATDFAKTTSPPVSNTTVPTEKVCPGGGGSGKAGPPNTKIKKRPKNRSDDATPTFKFKATETGTTFKCKLDQKRFKKCKSPKTYHGLDPGKHKFKVEAIDSDGNVDKTPAKDTFKVLG